MLPQTMDYTTDAASQAWDAVAEHLEAFAVSWESQGDPPDATQFVPDSPASVRRLVLIEILKYDIDCRLQRGLERTLEEYFKQFPELLKNGPPCDLLYEDFHLRRQAGQEVTPATYFRRFPEQAAELGLLLGTGTPSKSSSAFSARAPENVNPGDTIDDFDLLSMLGKGQFAKVFLARQRTMQRLVALKISARRGAEAETLAQLDHPHIVRVYDQRYVPERSLLLVYMTYLAGGTLHDVLDRARATPVEQRSGRTLLAAVDESLHRRGEVPPVSSSGRQVWAGRSWPATVCALGVKLASALDYAHRHQVLHRDVKPANVLLTSEGEPMLVDFNVGCCSKVEGASPTAFFGGSLAYMAPEHLEAFDPEHERAADSLDGRADVFGLAVTLWELLTGSRPYGAEELRGSWGETLKALVVQRRAGVKPEAILAFPEGDVPGFREVLLRCLESDPANRPADAGEMARELDLCLRPRTRELVRPKPGGWRGWLLRRPLVPLYMLGLAPNMVASYFNVYYNRREIVERWNVEAEALFDPAIYIINALFFPVGMFLFFLAIRPTLRGLRSLREAAPIDPADLSSRRLWTLQLGRCAAGSCVICWVIAGLIFPITLRVLAGPPPQGSVVYLHFLMSLVVCGLIAGTYPYFLVTFIAVRVYYPALLARRGPSPQDKLALVSVDRKLGLYRAGATAIPFVGVGLALLALNEHSQTLFRAVSVLCVVGLLGIGLAYVLEGRTRSDLAALADMPAEGE